MYVTVPDIQVNNKISKLKIPEDSPFKFLKNNKRMDAQKEPGPP